MDIWIILGILGTVVGIIAGVVQVLDYMQKRRKSQRTLPKAEGSQSHSHPDLDQYNIAAIRGLLKDAFTADDLHRFCQDRPAFRPVLSRFGSDASLEDLAEDVIEYCQKQALFPELLSGIQVVNPRQWERYRFQIHGESVAPPPAQKIPHNLPPRSEFVGREAEKAEMLQALCRSRIVCVEGIGGIGKTALALQVAHESLDASRGHNQVADFATFEGLIWTSAKDRSLVLNDLLNAVARTMGHTGIVQMSEDEKRDAVCNLLRDRSHLLIVDNYETISDGNVHDFLKTLPEPSKVLLTSREREWADAEIVLLRDLPRTESLELMRQLGERLKLGAIVESDDKELLSLYNITGGVPLAIKWAIGQIKQKGQSLDSVLAALTGVRASIFDDIFARSWDLLSPNAQEILMIMPIFVAPASQAAVERISNVHSPASVQAVGQLVEMMLVDATEELRPRYSIHPLTRAFAKVKLEQKPGFRAGAEGRWVDFFAAWRDQTGDPWAAWTILTDYEPGGLGIEAEIENILSAMEFCLWKDPTKWKKGAKMLDDYRAFLHMYGYWDKRTRICEQVISLAQEEGEERILGRAKGHLAWVLCFRDEYENGSDYARASLEIAQREGDIQGEYRSWHTLGRLALRQERYQEALANFGQAKRIAKEHYPSDLFAALYHLGLVEYEKGDLKQAEELFVKVLDEARKKHHKRAEVRSAYYLGELRLREGDRNQARDLFERGLGVAEAYGDKVAIANYRLGLARLSMNSGDLETARDSIQQAFELYRQWGMKKERDETKQILGTLEELISKGVRTMEPEVAERLEHSSLY